MTIEFHCPYCQKLLKTADDKAGVRANCPGCGQSVTVPDLAHEAAQADPSFVHGQPVAAASATPDAPPIDDGARGVSAPTKICPMCGETILQAATRCRFCGETFDGKGPEGVPQKVDAGEVVSVAWEIYKKNLGILLGATLIMGGAWLALYIIGQVVQTAIMFSLVGAGGPRFQPGGPPPVREMIAIYGSAFFFGMLNFAVVSCYLKAGYTRLVLQIARGENAEIGVMFSGGRVFWRVFFGSFLFSLIDTVGFMCLVVPGVMLLVIFWPYMFVIVDRDEGLVEAFRRSMELTSGNYLAGVVLGLVYLGAWMGGFMACIIGLAFAYPLAVLALAVAYCRMSGQRVAKA